MKRKANDIDILNILTEPRASKQTQRFKISSVKTKEYPDYSTDVSSPLGQSRSTTYEEESKSEENQCANKKHRGRPSKQSTKVISPSRKEDDDGYENVEENMEVLQMNDDEEDYQENVAEEEEEDINNVQVSGRSSFADFIEAFTDTFKREVKKKYKNERSRDRKCMNEEMKDFQNDYFTREGKMKKTIKEKNQEIIDKIKDINTLTQDNQKLEKKCKQMEENEKSLREEIDILKSSKDELEKLREENVQLQSSKKELEKCLDEVKLQKEKLSSDMGQMEKDLDTKKCELNVVNEKLKKLQESFNEQIAAQGLVSVVNTDPSRPSYDQLKTDLESALEECTTMKQILAQRNQVIENIKVVFQISRTPRALNQQNVRPRHIVDVVKDLENTKNAFGDFLTLLKAEVEDEVLNSLKTGLCDQNTKCVTLFGEFNDLRRRIQQCKDKIESFNLDDVKKDVAQMKSFESEILNEKQLQSQLNQKMLEITLSQRSMEHCINTYAEKVNESTRLKSGRFSEFEIFCDTFKKLSCEFFDIDEFIRKNCVSQASKLKTIQRECDKISNE